MVRNAIFNNISAISWRSVLLMEEIAVPGENHTPVTDKLSHNVVSSTSRPSGYQTHNYDPSWDVVTYIRTKKMGGGGREREVK